MTRGYAMAAIALDLGACGIRKEVKLPHVLQLYVKAGTMMTSKYRDQRHAQGLDGSDFKQLIYMPRFKPRGPLCACCVPPRQWI